MILSSTTKLSTRYYTHTHPFKGPLSRTTQVSRYQKGKTNLDFTKVRDSKWQWHQLGHMQVCTSLQTDNHTSTPPLSLFYRLDALPTAQPTVSKHWMHKHKIIAEFNFNKETYSHKSHNSYLQEAWESWRIAAMLGHRTWERTGSVHKQRQQNKKNHSRLP